MTPCELQDYAKGVLEGQQTADYRLASLIRAAVWSKDKMPAYDSLFKKREKEMSDDAMFEAVKALNKLFGGTEGK